MIQKKKIIQATVNVPASPSCRLVNECLVILVFILLSGCASANHGSLSRSRDVTRAFETFQVFADHRYYYLNQENNPYAVIALQSNYRISDPLWMELDPKSKTFKKVIGLVRDFPVYFNFPAYGSYMLDQQMNRVGLWYSSLRSVTFNVNNADRKVSVNTEKPWIDEDDEPFIRDFGRGMRYR